jgi:hypothetical protein
MRSTSLALIGAVAMLAACSDGTAPPDGATRVSLSFSTGSSVEAAPAAALAAAPISDGQNELVLSSVEVVLREIELKRVDVTDCDMEPEPDGCEKFETGPMLAQLPLDGSVAHVMSIDIEPGSYDEVEFDIHKVSSGDPEDAAFRSQYPDLVETSVRVQGEYNGTPFVFTTDLMDEQRYDLIPALVIADGTTTANVTLHLDLTMWFRDAGGSLVDPSTANKGEPNENLVKDNIRDSIDAFEDADRDGDRG